MELWEFGWSYSWSGPAVYISFKKKKWIFVLINYYCFRWFFKIISGFTLTAEGIEKNTREREKCGVGIVKRKIQSVTANL